MVLRRRHPAGLAELAAHQRFAGVLPAALVWRTRGAAGARKTDLICFLPKNRSDLFSAA
jgi:hypothetical protein